jgi:hypothetical protein
MPHIRFPPLLRTSNLSFFVQRPFSTCPEHVSHVAHIDVRLQFFCAHYNHLLIFFMFLPCIAVLCIENQHCTLGLVNIFITNAAPTCFGTYVPSSGSDFVHVSTLKLRQLCMASKIYFIYCIF